MEGPQHYWVAGKPCWGDASLDVLHPDDQHTVGRVSLPVDEHIEEAVRAASDAARSFGGASAYERARALRFVSDSLVERAEEFALTIVAESGKPLKWARFEVARAASTFGWAAEEARRWSGEMQRLDTEPHSRGRLGLTRRFPRGPVLAIAPFNFPLNLVAHKVAPALAVGAPVLIKPAPATPLSALLLGEVLSGAGLPVGSWSVLPVPNDRMEALVGDPRLPVVSFTGSGPVGWAIKAAVPRKHVTLELGGNAAAVVCGDWTAEEDLEYAADRIATFATYQAGQSCISVQRVYSDRSVHQALVARVAERMEKLVQGNPYDEATDVGPLVDVQAASRVEAWVDEAVADGAVVVVGGTRSGARYAPTLLVDVPAHSRICREEVFGPVVAMMAVDGVDEAFAAVNDSDYGLQAGLFTRDLHTAFRAHRELEVGGVVVGDVPSYRADQAPYGGVKASGVGREGVRYAMEDLTQDRVLILTGLEL